MSAWYYVIDGDPAFLTAEPEDDAELGQPIDWAAALASLRRHAPARDGADPVEFEFPGLYIQVEAVDDDGEVRGIGFSVSMSSLSLEQDEGMAQLVKLMLAVADDLDARAWSDDQQRWLTPADIDGARTGEPV